MELKAKAVSPPASLADASDRLSSQSAIKKSPKNLPRLPRPALLGALQCSIQSGAAELATLRHAASRIVITSADRISALRRLTRSQRSKSKARSMAIQYQTTRFCVGACLQANVEASNHRCLGLTIDVGFENQRGLKGNKAMMDRLVRIQRSIPSVWSDIPSIFLEKSNLL